MPDREQRTRGDAETASDEDITRLAEWTSAITLIIFMTVCAALTRIKARGDAAPEGTFLVPAWIPWCGIVACGALLVAGTAMG